MKKYHHCVKFTYPLSFQTRIPKVDQHTGGKWLIHGTKHRKDRLSFWKDEPVDIKETNGLRPKDLYQTYFVEWLYCDR